MKILEMTTHLNVGGITSYLYMTGSRLVRMGHEVSVLSAGGDSEERFLQKKIRLYKFPIRTKSELSPKLYAALPKIIKLVKEEKIDLIHAHTRVTQVMAFFISLMTKVPVVTTAHGYYKPRLGRRMFGAWGKRVIAVSPLVAEEIKKSHRVNPNRIRIVQNAVDIEDLENRLAEKTPFKMRMDYGVPQDAKVIGCIARLVRDKGQEVLIKAVKELKKSFPDIYLLIVGDGREKNRYEDLVKKLGLEKNAKVISSQVDVTEILSMLDVFVQPATFREGFGLTLVEAMAAKKPVVASDIWAINTVIRHHVNGFLVPANNPKELAQTLIYVLKNPDSVGDIVENAYSIATELYSIDRMVSEMETVYKEAVAKC